MPLPGQANANSSRPATEAERNVNQPHAVGVGIGYQFHRLPFVEGIVSTNHIGLQHHRPHVGNSCATRANLVFDRVSVLDIGDGENRAVAP